MNGFPTSGNFQKHCANLRAIQASMTQIERVHKQAIRRGDVAAEGSLRRVHALLLGVFAEARLRKIIDDPTGFNDRERKLIWLEKSQDKRWVAAVDLAARRHFQVLSHQELNQRLPSSALARIDAVTLLLEEDLAPIIVDRNKLAHGQWVWQLRSRSEDVFSANQVRLDYNYAALRARYRLLDLIGDLVNVLCVSAPTFDRDFEILMEKIDDAKSRLDGAGYADLVDQLKDRNRSR